MEDLSALSLPSASSLPHVSALHTGHTIRRERIHGMVPQLTLSRAPADIQSFRTDSLDMERLREESGASSS